MSMLKISGTSIGDLQTQLEFLVKEMSEKYSSIWENITTTDDIQKSSDDVLLHFEAPEAMYSKIGERKSRGDYYYERNHGTAKISNSSSNTSSSATQTVAKSLDNFLFIGDSRFASTEVMNGLMRFGDNISVEAVVASNPEQWIDTVKNGSGTVNGTSITLPDSADGVCLQLGVNNLSQTGKMEELLDNLHSRYPNAKIFVTSVYHLGTLYSGSATNDDVDSYNQSMRDFCNQNSWADYIDVLDNLDDSSGNLKSEFSSDGLHLSSSSGISTFVSNIKDALSGSGTVTTSSGSGSSSRTTYSIVVANRTTTNTTVRTDYEWQSTTYYNYSQPSSSSQYSETPVSKTDPTITTTRLSSSSVNYQDALKDYTLYFDFLWAVLINSKNPMLIEEWADLVCDNIKSGNIMVTVYNDIVVSESEFSSTDKPISIVSDVGGNVHIYVDTFSTIKTTQIVTNKLTSKLAVTYADTWLVKYENNPNTYDEYKSKSVETIVEKIDSKSLDPNIIKIFKSYPTAFKTITDEKDTVTEMLEDNENVSFMIDIYGYILNLANGTSDDSISFSDILDVNAFDLTTFSKVNRGTVSGDGANGGERTEVENADGYYSIFSVGTRTYKEYKQSSGSWAGTNVTTMGTMGNFGCALTAIAVVATGYEVDITPGDVAALVNGGQYHWGDHAGILNHYIGKNCYWINGAGAIDGSVTDVIIEQLNSGKPCMVEKTNTTHFFCILAIRTNDDGSQQVYVSDVGGNYPSKPIVTGSFAGLTSSSIGPHNTYDINGWMDISILDLLGDVMIIED